MPSCKIRALVALLACSVVPAWAQVTIPQEYDKLIQHRGEITAFGAEGFGDKVDLNSGSLEIVQTDVDLPGNDALPVRVSRRFVAADRFALGHFFQWNLDIPYIHGIFGNHPTNPKGWTVDGATAAEMYKRCTSFGPPRTMTFQGDVFEPDEYWHGTFLHIPGAGDEEMLTGGAASSHTPSDGSAYMAVTKGGVALRCVALASTSESGAQGEGFEAVMPDGTVYTLNQMVSRTNETISKPIGQPPFPLAGTGERGVIVTPMGATTFTLARVEVLLFPTKATDKYGNTVTYTWSGTTPWQLLQITASDGRQLTFTYTSGTSQMVSSVSDGTRTWTYSYNTGGLVFTRPDGSTWVSNLSDLFNLKIQSSGDGCSGDPVLMGSTTSVKTGTLTAPTGAVATFSMSPRKFARSYVWWSCVFDLSGPAYAREPTAYYNHAVIGKTITGPGLPSAGLSWTYTYGPAVGCFAPGHGIYECTGSSATTRTVSVSAPDGDVTRYTFGNKFYENEGLALKVESGWNGTSALRTVETSYAEWLAAPYTSYYGGTPRTRGDTLISSYIIPKRKVATTQQGRTFTWEVAADCASVPYCFDTYARPTKVVKSSSP